MIDKPKFMRDFLKIAAKGSEIDEETGMPKGNLIVPLAPNKVQLNYLEHKTSRNVVLKARQQGYSTIILADFFIDVTSIMGLAASVISYGDKPTRRLLTKVHLFYNLFPQKGFLPKIRHQSDNMLSFPNLQSSFYINTSRAAIVGRGETVHRCHLSEYAFYDRENPGRAEEIMAEVGQAVPIKTGVLTVESTPNARGDSFFNLYMGAKNHTNNFTPFFSPWWMAEDYFMTDREVQEGHEEDKEANFKLTNEEEFLSDLHHLTHDQIRWRRYKIRELGNKFFREYPEDDNTCWLNPESMIFDKDAIDRLIRLKVPQLLYRPAEYLTVWENPDGSELYVMGIDTASGLPTGDYSTASILKVSNGTEVAAIRGKIPVDVLAGMVARVGKEYNTCLIGVEGGQGAGHGGALLKYLENMGYPNIYWHVDKEGKPDKPGWMTSHVTRPIMIDDFDKALRSGAFRTSNEQLLNECQGFIMENGKAQAERGNTDDSLFAAMIAWQIREQAIPMYSGGYVPADSYMPVFR